MGSKREEERNEKIIRGLMKLPPNRRCINCNSLGPQYVCTNFWTFVCMPCSGIHREFTHRVKSVSMAKFTSQEVDALQKGGNQRARELFLNTWDPLRHKHPDNSNADKVREFIRNVYVKKIYAVDQSSDRPPKDPQSVRSREDEMRRASSYHSYSQSPPYDFQYEERRYGKPVASLTRKHGSDRGLYEGRMSSLSSPSRFSDHANDERFANEGSFPRVSDYSVSSGGDPFRSDVLSPSPQRGTWSPFNETSSNFSSEVNHTIPHLDANAGKISRPQVLSSYLVKTEVQCVVPFTSHALYGNPCLFSVVKKCGYAICECFWLLHHLGSCLLCSFFGYQEGNDDYKHKIGNQNEAIE